LLSCGAFALLPLFSDLYVSLDGMFPTQSAYNWRSTRFGSELIIIPKPVPSVYMIGVFAWTQSLFSVTAATPEVTAQVPVQEQQQQQQVTQIKRHSRHHHRN